MGRLKNVNASTDHSNDPVLSVPLKCCFAYQTLRWRSWAVSAERPSHWTKCCKRSGWTARLFDSCEVAGLLFVRAQILALKGSFPAVHWNSRRTAAQALSSLSS